MPASDSKPLPQSPAVYRARVTFFSFPVSWAFLEDATERKLPDRAELERNLRSESAMPIPQSAHLDSSEKEAAPAADQWEMVIPKMSRAPHRAHKLNPVKESGDETAARERRGV